MIRRVSCVLLLLSVSGLSARAEESGYLGVVLGVLPDGASSTQGAIVQEIILDSPADLDGLRSGDVVVAINDQEITDAQGMVDAIKSFNSGDKPRLKLVRAGEQDKKELTITLANRPAKPVAELPVKKRPSLGVAFSLQADGRLAVAQFLPDSAAEQAGLKAGDVITTISGHDATDYVAVLSLIAAHKSGEEVKIEVLRDSQTQELTAKLK